jgi:hypothetical protein
MTTMVGRTSRYRGVPGMTSTGPDGGAPAVPELRPLPRVAGSYRHVVQAGERLDLLATTYYGQPSEWWQICDANPETPSPLALVGADPVVTTLVPLQPSADAPPWARLLAVVSALDGVHRVELIDEVELRTTRRTVAGRDVSLVQEIPVRALQVTHNRRVVDADAIVTAVIGLVPVGPVVERSRVGEEIVVPPLSEGTESS